MFHEGAKKFRDIFAKLGEHSSLQSYGVSLFVHRCDGQLVYHHSSQGEDNFKHIEVVSSLVPAIWECGEQLFSLFFSDEDGNQDKFLSFGNSQSQTLVIPQSFSKQKFLFVFVIPKQENIAKIKYQLTNLIRFGVFLDEEILEEDKNTSDDMACFKNLREEEIDGIFNFQGDEPCH